MIRKSILAEECIIRRYIRKHKLTIVKWENFLDYGLCAVVNDGELYAGTLSANICKNKAFFID